MYNLVLLPNIRECFKFCANRKIDIRIVNSYSKGKTKQVGFALICIIHLFFYIHKRPNITHIISYLFCSVNPDCPFAISFAISLAMIAFPLTPSSVSILLASFTVV